MARTRDIGSRQLVEPVRPPVAAHPAVCDPSPISRTGRLRAPDAWNSTPVCSRHRPAGGGEPRGCFWTANAMFATSAPRWPTGSVREKNVVERRCSQSLRQQFNIKSRRRLWWTLIAETNTQRENQQNRQAEHITTYLVLPPE